jgi:hypothetical protein
MVEDIHKDRPSENIRNMAKLLLPVEDWDGVEFISDEVERSGIIEASNDYQ